MDLARSDSHCTEEPHGGLRQRKTRSNCIQLQGDLVESRSGNWGRQKGRAGLVSLDWDAGENARPLRHQNRRAEVDSAVNAVLASSLNMEIKLGWLTAPEDRSLML